MSEAVEEQSAAITTVTAPEVATGTAETTASTATVLAQPEEEPKPKRTATPKQLEALRLARVAKQEKAAARRLECQKLAGRITIEQNSSDSDSEEAEYVIKKVKRRRAKNEAATGPSTREPTPALDTREEDGDSSDGDDGRPRNNKKKQPATRQPTDPPLTLHFV